MWVLLTPVILLIRFPQWHVFCFFVSFVVKLKVNAWSKDITKQPILNGERRYWRTKRDERSKKRRHREWRESERLEKKKVHFYPPLLLLFSLRGEPRNAMRNLVRDKERKVDGTVLNSVCVCVCVMCVAVCLLEFTWKVLLKFILCLLPHESALL